MTSSGIEPATFRLVATGLNSARKVIGLILGWDNGCPD
jgi:hypothetical protein